MKTKSHMRNGTRSGISDKWTKVEKGGITLEAPAMMDIAPGTIATIPFFVSSVGWSGAIKLVSYLARVDDPRVAAESVQVDVERVVAGSKASGSIAFPLPPDASNVGVMLEADLGAAGRLEHRIELRVGAARALSPCLRFAVRPTASVTPDGRVQIKVAFTNCGWADLSVNLEVRLDDAGNVVLDKPTLVLKAGKKPIDVTLSVKDPLSSPDPSMTLAVKDPNGETLLTQEIAWTPPPPQVPSIRNLLHKPVAIFTGAGAVVVATAAILVATVWPRPEPIDPVGTWDVSDFVFQATDPQTENNFPLEGGEMTIEQASECKGDDCDLVIAVGPDMVEGVRLYPEDGGSQYVGDGVNVVPTCGDVSVPPDLTSSQFIAEAGDGDDLTFIVETELTTTWEGCEPFGARYEASATRIE